MAAMNESVFKPGQIVEAVWPDGVTMIRGKVARSGGPGVPLRVEIVGWGIDGFEREGATITVVKEPPVPEPIGLFALVRLSNGIVMRRSNMGDWYSYEVHMGSYACNKWSEFEDEVVEVLFPGVTS